MCKNLSSTILIALLTLLTPEPVTILKFNLSFSRSFLKRKNTPESREQLAVMKETLRELGRDLDQLKNKIIKVIIIVLIVKFFEKKFSY